MVINLLLEFQENGCSSGLVLISSSRLMLLRAQSTIRREKSRYAHMSDLRLHHPFSAEVFDTAVSSSYAPPHKDPPPEGFCSDFPGPDSTLKIGQLCVVYVPSFAPEDLCIIRYLGNDQYQWFSNWSRHSPGRTKRSSIETFARTAWLPGWVTYFDNKIVIHIEDLRTTVEFLQLKRESSPQHTSSSGVSS